MNAPLPRHKSKRNLRTSAILLVFTIFLIGLVIPPVQSDNSQDGTYCWKRFNLDPVNTRQISVPTVVDIDMDTGNLLVRGQLPFVVRNTSGNTDGCMNGSDWSYAYDGLNALMLNKKAFVPAYFNKRNNNTEKIGKLQDAMKDFSLDNYEIVDISLLHNQNDRQQVGELQHFFGETSSSCNSTPVTGTLHGRNASLILSEFYFCQNGADAATCKLSITSDIDESIDSRAKNACSAASRIDQIRSLMSSPTASGKKRLIYYHCSAGSDRTGAVTMEYLQTTIPGMSYAHAMNYAQYLGKESQGGDAIWPVKNNCDTAALAYCRFIGADCTQTEAARVMLPGSDTHTHLPGQEDPSVTPAPTQVPVPAQTPVPSERYNPKNSNAVNF